MSVQPTSLFQYLLDIGGDTTPAKAIIATGIGFAFGSAGLAELDLKLSIILKCAGLVAFLFSALITLPRVIELFQKILKAIKTTFDD